MNFFEERRTTLGLSRTQIAAIVRTTAEPVRQWEADTSVPRPSIELLATAYRVSEARMEKEVMALRRRIEARRAELVVTRS